MKQTVIASASRLLLGSLAIAGILSLAACGGGGGSSGGAGAATSVPGSGSSGASGGGSNSGGSTVVQAATVVDSVPPPTYTGASEESLAFALLNDQRSKCGFGMAAQNALLDTAAKGHADWQLINATIGHFQTAGTPGFTGIAAIDRAAAAGYVAQGITDELTTIIGSASNVGQGAASIRTLLSAPYHLVGLTGAYREIGVSVRSSTDVGVAAPRTVQQYDLAYTAAAGKQEPASDAILTYPCSGTTGVNYRVTNESPNPIPGRDLLASPIGPGILVALRTGQVLTISSASMATVSGNVPVALRAAMTKDTDPNGALTANQALIIPDAALTPSTDYNVSIAGTNGPTAFTRTFVFTTGTGG